MIYFLERSFRIVVYKNYKYSSLLFQRLSYILKTSKINMAKHLQQKIEIDDKHIDEYGHVNYKSHPLLLERFQDEYMKEVVGLSFSEIENKFGLLSVVRKMNVDYSGQLHRGDSAEVTIRVSNIGNTSFTLSQEIFNNGIKVTSLEMVVVMCDATTLNKSTIPEELRERLSRSKNRCTTTP